MAKVQRFDAVQAGLGASRRRVENEKYVFTQFRAPIFIAGADHGALDAIDTSINTISCGAETFQWRLEQPNATVPVNSLDGLYILNDAGDNDGWELTLGRANAAGAVENTIEKGAFTIGTDPAFFLRVKLDVVDVSDTDNLVVGFSAGNYVADGNIDTETDAAVFNIDNGSIKIDTVLNNGATGSTDTTDAFADNGQHTFEVRVSGTGVATFYLDGAQPTTIPTAFQFDTGDVVHAYVGELNSTTDDPEVSIMEWESGYLSTRGLANATDLVELSQSS